MITNNNKSNPRYYNYIGKTVIEVESENVMREYETAVCFGRDGKVIYAQVQDEKIHVVRFTKYQMKRTKAMDVTHNHPYSTPPSPEDLHNILKNGEPKLFRICGKNGAYVLKYTNKIKNLPEYKVFDREYDDILERNKRKYLNMVKENMCSMNEAEIMLQEDAWNQMSKKYNIDYSFDRRG